MLLCIYFIEIFVTFIAKDDILSTLEQVLAWYQTGYHTLYDCVVWYIEVHSWGSSSQSFSIGSWGKAAVLNIGSTLSIDLIQTVFRYV